jgi:branched-chain amino acid transport system permease protein
MQSTLSGLMVGVVYATLAVAFVVIYRASQVFNFAQGMILTFGGYLALTILSIPWIPIGVGIVLALFLSAVFGVVIERVIFRRLIGQPVFSMVMVTLGLYVMLTGIVMVVWGPTFRIFPEIFSPQALRMSSFHFPPSLFWGGFISIAIIIGLVFFFEKTKWGLRMSAVAEGQQVAQALGISVKQSMAIAWAISSVISTFAAIVLLSGRTIGIGASDVGLRALPVALLAGIESIKGTLPAGVIFGVAAALGSLYLDKFTSGGIADILPFVIMVIIVAIRPSGLFGWKTIERM